MVVGTSLFYSSFMKKNNLNDSFNQKDKYEIVSSNDKTKSDTFVLSTETSNLVSEESANKDILQRTYDTSKVINEKPDDNSDENIVMSLDASFERLTLADIVNQGEIIVKAKVIDVSVYMWNNNENKAPSMNFIRPEDMIYRNIEIVITEVIKGDVSIGQKMKIRSYGGVLDKFEMLKVIVSDVSVNDEVILSLEKDVTIWNNEKDNSQYKPVYDNHGLFVIKGDSARSFQGTYQVDKLISNIQYYLANPGVDLTIKADPKEHSVMKK